MGKLSWNFRPRQEVVLLFTVVILLAHESLFAQTLSLKQFLKSSVEDVVYKSFDSQAALLGNSKNYSLPWINQVQFRFQDNELVDYQTRFGLRLDAANPIQVSRNKKYFQGYQTLKMIEQKMVLKEIIRDRYDKVVDYWMASANADLIEKQKAIREQLAFTLTQKSGSSNFNPEQYLNSQLDIIAKEADWAEANFERDVAKTKIMEFAGANNFELPIDDLVDVDQINQIIKADLSPSSNTELELLRQRMQVATSKMKLENANFDLGYIQGLYSVDNRLTTQPDTGTPLGIAVGVNIPIFNPNKDKVARERLTMIERQADLDQFQSEEKIKRINSAAYLQLHLRHYQKIDSLTSALKSKGMNALTSVANNFDPMIELKYQEKLIQFDLLKVRIKKEILLQYISYLDNSDRLHERPLVNYLSKNLERVED